MLINARPRLAVCAPQYRLLSQRQRYRRRCCIMPAPFYVRFLAKHARGHIHNAAKAYGWHRIYRRLLEANRRLVPHPEGRALVRRNLKEAFRFPNRVADVLQESHTMAFLHKYANEVAAGVESRVPPFFVKVAKFFVTRSPVGQLFSIFGEMTRPSSKKPPPSR